MTVTTLDRLLGGRVLLEQPADGLRAAVDAVLLAAAVPARPGDAVLELGCGTGVAFLCLAARVAGLTIHAVDLDPALVPLARANAGRAGLTTEILEADMRRPMPPVRHAFANPPYWPAGTASPNPLRRGAAHEGTAGLAAWAAALALPVDRRGTVTMILPAARFSEAAAALRAGGCGSLALGSPPVASSSAESRVAGDRTACCQGWCCTAKPASPRPPRRCCVTPRRSLSEKPAA